MSQYYIYCKKADFNRLAGQFHISPILARILRNRDLISDSEIGEYLYGGTELLYDPFRMKGIEEAVPLLFDAVKAGKKIRIIGDYDCDGVCSSYILQRYLSFLGANADIRLPDRVKDGYGMNPDMVKEASKDGVGLLLTCDNGVSSYAAVEEAKRCRIPVIITDHHEVPLPLIEADAVLDPKQPDDTYPYHELCGAGVAYKLLCAMDRSLFGGAAGNDGSSAVQSADDINDATGKTGPEAAQTIDGVRKAPEKAGLGADRSLEVTGGAAASKALLRELLQYVAIATIADVVPLNGENRILAKEGMQILRETENPGLLALMRERRIEPAGLNSYHIGFILAPAINSAGRLKKADIALNLLKADGEDAARLAKELSDLNQERKHLTEIQFADANRVVEEMLERDGKLPLILVLYLPEAHESIAGILAGRLKDRYERPALVLTDSKEGLKGSGRSVENYNLIEELRKQQELFLKLGGHAKAAGFTLAKGVSAEDLSERLVTQCQSKEEDLAEKKWIDMKLPFTFANGDLIREIGLLEPFGTGNPQPVFAAEQVRVNRVMLLGRNNNVLRLSLTDADGRSIEGIYYGSEEMLVPVYEAIFAGKEREGEAYRISFVYLPEWNEFRGERSVQLRIQDMIRY